MYVVEYVVPCLLSVHFLSFVLAAPPLCHVMVSCCTSAVFTLPHQTICALTFQRSAGSGLPWFIPCDIFCTNDQAFLRLPSRTCEAYSECTHAVVAHNYAFCNTSLPHISISLARPLPPTHTPRYFCNITRPHLHSQVLCSQAAIGPAHSPPTALYIMHS